MAEDTINPSNISSTANLFNKNINKNQSSIKNKAMSEISKTSKGIVNFTEKANDKILEVSKNSISTTKDIAKSFSSSITKDMDINKQNLVAQSLARSSPIFGYYASKFIETDVFRNFSSKIKKQLGNALSFVTSKFKKGFSGIFNFGKSGVTSLFEKFKGAKNNETPKAPTNKPSVSIEDLKNKGLEVPKLAKGGAIEEGGLAQVHAAEVVAPINKILKSMEKVAKPSKDEMDKISQGTIKSLQIQKQLSDVVKQSQKRITLTEEENKKERGIFREFFSNLKDEIKTSVNGDEGKEESQHRAILEIRNAVAPTGDGIVSLLSNAWRRTLFEHPGLRALTSISKAIVKSPFRVVMGLFRRRGNYESHIRRFAQGSPMAQTASILGLMYPGIMYKLDNIIQALTGEEKKEGWSIMGAAFGGVKGLTKLVAKTTQSAFLESRKGYLESEGEGTAKRIGQTGLGALKGGGKQLGEETGVFKAARGISNVTKNMTDIFTSEGRERRRLKKEEAEKAKGRKQELQRFGETPQLLRQLNEKTKPVSLFYKSKADKLFSYQKLTSESQSKLLSYNKAQAKYSEKTSKRLRSRNIIQFLMMAGGMITSTLSTLIGGVTSILGSILTGITTLVGIRKVSQLGKGGSVLRKGKGLAGKAVRGIGRLGAGALNLAKTPLSALGATGAAGMAGATAGVAGAGAGGYMVGSKIQEYMAEKTGSKSWLFDYLLGNPGDKKDKGLIGSSLEAASDVAKRVKEGFTNALDTTKNTFSNLTDKVKKSLSGMKDKGTNIAKGVKEGFTNALDTTKDIFSNLTDKVKKSLLSLKDKGLNIAKGLWEKTKGFFTGDDENKSPLDSIRKGMNKKDKSNSSVSNDIYNKSEKVLKDKEKETTGFIQNAWKSAKGFFTGDDSVKEVDNKSKDKTDKSSIIKAQLTETLSANKEFQKMSEQGQQKMIDNFTSQLKELVGNFSNVSNNITNIISENMSSVIQNMEDSQRKQNNQPSNSELAKIFYGEVQ